VEVLKIREVAADASQELQMKEINSSRDSLSKHSPPPGENTRNQEGIECRRQG